MSIRVKRPRSPSPGAVGDLNSSQNQTKKLKLLASHTAATPFPDFTRPSVEEAYQIHDLLSKAHPDIVTTFRDPSETSNSAKTCGNVPNVLESLIGTVLSQNTSARNSTAAKRSLDEAFGRNNFEAIATAKKVDVVNAIREGGLANKKADVIQRILKQVHDKYGRYSLQHLAKTPDLGGGSSSKFPEAGREQKESDGPSISNEEAMKELVSFEGVGPKTASCVLMFSLGRCSFPVDTHVFRLSGLLGWVPPRADRITAQAHLDFKLPDELKYGLHVLMVGHGRRCKGCKSVKVKGVVTTGCVLKEWLREGPGDLKSSTKREAPGGVQFIDGDLGAI